MPSPEQVFAKATWGQTCGTPGCLVRDKSGRVWKIVSLQQFSGDSYTAELQGESGHPVRVPVGWTEPVDVDTRWLSQIEIDPPIKAEPTPNDGLWHFPVMTNPKHLASHLFIVHGIFDLAERSVLLHDFHDDLHDSAMTDGQYPHDHQENPC